MGTRYAYEQVWYKNLFIMIPIAIGALVIIIFIIHYATKSPTPLQLANKKLNNAKELSSKLTLKENHLFNSKTDFEKEVETSVKAISELLGSNKETTELKEAQKDPRISDELEVLAKAEAYKRIIDQEYKLTKSAKQKLEKLQKLLALDIKLIESLEPEQIDKLIKDLDVAINQYAPTAKDLIVSLKEEQMPTNTELWKLYFETNDKTESPPEK